MDSVTKNVAKYIKDKGINLAKMSRDTGLTYMSLYDSLLNGERDRNLRVGEFFEICLFLGVDPMEFAEKPNKEECV